MFQAQILDYINNVTSTHAYTEKTRAQGINPSSNGASA